MTTYKTIEQWLKANPSQEEQRKVLILINKGAVNHTRKEIYDLQRYLRKLSAGENYMKNLGLSLTEDGQRKIKEVKEQITELSKGLPEPVKRVKMETV